MSFKHFARHGHSKFSIRNPDSRNVVIGFIPLPYVIPVTVVVFRGEIAKNEPLWEENSRPFVTQNKWEC